MSFRCAVAAIVLLTGCAPENRLEGSVEELFPLDVSWVEVLRNDEALQVSYYRNRGADVDGVVRVTVALKDVDLDSGEPIPLQGEWSPGHPRTTVLHFPAGEPGRLFAPVKQGELELHEGGAPGEETRGEFTMSFEQGDGFGAGRTLTGTFRATAQDAGFGDP